MGITFIRPSLTASPTGQPLPVADAIERLALTPVEGMRVKQTDNGMVWAYEGTWYPAPHLDYDLSASTVLADQVYKSRDNPFGSSGSYIPLAAGGEIYPDTAWCEHIAKFSNLGSLSITDLSVIYVDPAMVARYYKAQNYVTGVIGITINGNIPTGYIDNILAAIDAEFIGATSMSGSIELMGSNGGPTSSSAAFIASGQIALGGTYTNTGDYNSHPIYTGVSSESSHDVQIRWDAVMSRWEIWDGIVSSVLYWSQGNEANPWDVTAWYDVVSLSSFYVTETLVANSHLLAIIARGLTVSTN